MIRQHPIDCGGLYEQERQRLAQLAGALEPARLAEIVPATPEWTVQDVVAHLVGITASLNAGDLAQGGGDEWADRTVTDRRGRSLEDVLVEWDREAPAFEDGLRLFGYEVGSHFVGDLVQHAIDVDHALGRPRRPDDDGVTVALDFYLDSFDQSLRAAGRGVAVTVAGQTWTLGSAEASAGVAATPFELLRALGGRRSEEQLRALTWTGDVDAVLGLVSRYALPPTAIVES